jgi:hypothetical protein
MSSSEKNLVTSTTSFSQRSGYHFLSKLIARTQKTPSKRQTKTTKGQEHAQLLHNPINIHKKMDEKTFDSNFMLCSSKGHLVMS